MKKLLLLTLSFKVVIAASQPVVWTEKQQWGTISTATSFIGFDNQNSIYVTGAYGSPGGSFLSRYDQQGNLLWSDTMNYKFIRACALDSIGNIFTIIYFNNGHSFNLCKLNSLGQLLSNVLITNGSLEVKNLKLGYDGFLYMNAMLVGPAIIGSDTLNNYNGSFITKLSTSGSVIWTKQIKNLSSNPTNKVFGVNIEIGRSGNIYIAGSIKGQASIDNTVFSGSNSSFFATLNHNGSLKNVFTMNLATEMIRMTNNDEKICIKGEFVGSYSFGSSTIYQTTNSYSSYFIAVRDTSGWLWATELPSLGRGEIAVDKNFSIYCMGNWNNQSTGGGGYNIVQFDSAGNQLWNYTSAQGSQSDICYMLAVDNLGDIFTGGQMSDNGTMKSYLTKYSKAATDIKNENSNIELNIFPNPGFEYFNIELACQCEMNNISLKIRNALGQEVLSKNYRAQANKLTERLNVQILPKGFYFLEIIVNRRREVRKIIIK